MSYGQSYATQYRQMEVKTADQFELLLILYKGAIGKLQSAKKHLQSGDIEARVAALNKATAMIGELQAALDFERGGQIAQSLDRLYTYMTTRLAKANLLQSEEQIDEVIKLLATLQSAWEEAQTLLANENPVAIPNSGTTYGDRVTLHQNNSMKVSIGA